MKKIIKFSALFLIASLAACEGQESLSDDAAEGICFSVEDFTAEDVSRASIATNGQFSWQMGDTLGIFPEQGYQTAFPISEGMGSSTAYFDGGQWALRKNARYAAYFPFMHPMDQIQKTAIPVSYEGQTQYGNNSAAHLGKYDYLATTFTDVNASGGADFQLKHLGALVRFKLTMPEAASYTSMELSTSAGTFAHTATYALSDDIPSLTPTTSAQTIELALSNVSTTSSNKELILYMFLAPCDYTGKAFTITLKNASNKYLVTIAGKNLESGKAYSIVATCSQPVANHPYIDLGLPSGTLWATTNIGANNPEDAGDYFAWAETTPKNNFSWSNYAYMTSGYSTWGGCSKYTFADGNTSGVWYNMAGSFVGDNKKQLESADDAATALWGSEWCMPTIVQFEELLNSDNCSWTWTTSYGVNGFEVKSKTNGNSIFLPAVGYKKSTDFVNKGTNGYYWSSTLSTTYSDTAFYLFYYSESHSKAYNSRYYGQSIRPVRK